MIGVMRQKFGPKIIGGVIAVIAFVFIFYGIFVPGMRGGSPGAAGEVNGETITSSDFGRALNQRVEFLKSMMGGKVTEEQLEQFHIREAVFQDLVQRKLMTQMARKEGFYPAAEQIREQIVRMDAFKKDGAFDKMRYKEVLTQNGYNPTRFEELVASDLMEQDFRSYIQSLAYVSPEEVDRELKASKERVKVKYLFLDNESARKLLPQDTAKNAAKASAGAESAPAGEKLEEKINALAPAMLEALSANQDAKAASLVQASGVKVKTSEWLNTQAEFVPGIGAIGMIRKELFSQPKGAPAKRYALAGGTLFAKVADTESYDPAKVSAKERKETLAKLESAKQSEILSGLLKAWMKKASVSRNDAIVVKGQGGLPLSMEE